MATKQSRKALRVWALWGAAVALVGGLVVGVVVAQTNDSVTANGRFELGDGVEPFVPGTGDIAGASVQTGPDWNDLFNSNRSPKDVFDEFGTPGGNGVPDFLDTFGSFRLRRDGSFIADDISAGSNTDDSVFVGPDLVGGGTVAAAHDIGNVYAYSTFDSQRNLILYAGVERLSGGSGSIVLEFNRHLFSLGAGGAITGQRVAGDVRIQADFSGAALVSLGISKWSEIDSEAGLFDWVSLETLPIDPQDPVEQCNASGTLCAVCNEASVDGGAWPNYDAEGNAITDLVPDTFMEFGFNLTSILGVHSWQNYYGTRYAGIQVSSYDDAASPTALDYAQGSFVRASKLAR